MNEVPDADLTPVIFKMVHGYCIALFPAEPFSTSFDNCCTSYVHVGQHGGAACHVARNWRPAKVDEYADLKSELESEPYGYRFKIVRRFNDRYKSIRDKEIARMRKIDRELTARGE